jgi:Flp pilus assembly protein TadG
MLRLRARRGAIAILTVMLFLALMAVGAVVLDFARAEVMRNQLQTAADAAALAGAVQLTRNPKTSYLDQAKAYGHANAVLGSAVVVPDAAVEVGNWDPVGRAFTSTNSATTADAVRVTLHDTASYLVANVLGWTRKPIAARAVAWAGPSVAQTQCMKPWALWMGQLMERINAYRGLPPDPTRPMTPEDLQALREMSDAQRRFTVFLGHAGQDSTFNGNYYAVTLPPFYHADGSTSDAGTGADEYEANISGEKCNTVNVGDSLLTEPGIMTGKTCAGVMGTNNCNQSPTDRGICQTLVNNDCKGPNGEDVRVKTAFWSAPPTANGRFAVAVQLIGSFKLEKFYPTDDKSTRDRDEAASLTGVFEPLADPGPIGSSTTTLVKIVLVQ